MRLTGLIGLLAIDIAYYMPLRWPDPQVGNPWKERAGPTGDILAGCGSCAPVVGVPGHAVEPAKQSRGRSRTLAAGVMPARTRSGPDRELIGNPDSTRGQQCIK
jgi:hypothetical protein